MPEALKEGHCKSMMRSHWRLFMIFLPYWEKRNFMYCHGKQMRIGKVLLLMKKKYWFYPVVNGTGLQTSQNNNFNSNHLRSGASLTGWDTGSMQKNYQYR